MRQSGPSAYHMRDIWEWYSYRLLRSNPDWIGVTKNRVQNYFLYAKYRDEKGKWHLEEVFSYRVFMDCMTTFFDLAKDYIVQGEKLDMLFAMGWIMPKRVERDHRKKSVNFIRTNAQPTVWSEEKQEMVASKVIYHTADDWCKIFWKKRYHPGNKSPFVKNVPCYQFKPAKDLRSGRGFDQLLCKALQSDPLLKYKFPFYPIKSKKA